MRTQVFRFIAIALSVLLLGQSCVAYKKTSISAQEAVNSELPLKVSIAGKDYKIRSIEQDNDNLYAITKANSKLAKAYGEKVQLDADKMVKVDLTESSIDSIREKDTKASTVYTILTAIVSAGVVALLIYGINLGGGAYCC